MKHASRKDVSSYKKMTVLTNLYGGHPLKIYLYTYISATCGMGIL